ncbi:hypercellular protein A [Coniella lustricola]|uniref:Hypercellular protein A n=1 Tax=Coniella lustricola TaxID=2025994 RepID=A0A2T3AJS3_9PEZI|nr:hypercellular protein A [Coniella lustricola]
MSADSLLPIAPARVRALCVPIGQIKTDRFASFLERLQAEHVVHLRDVGADKRPNRTMFSPLAFPDGAIFYDFATHVPPPSHLALLPFDFYRETLVVIAVADGTEVGKVPFSKTQTGETLADRNIRALYQGLESLRDSFPKAIVHQLLIFDYTHPEDHAIPLPEGIVAIPPPDQWKRTTMRTVMCDVSTLLLAEMTGLAKSFEALSYIESPGQGTSAPASIPEEPKIRRRNSQFTLGRSTSASGALEHKEARLSMPLPFKSSPPNVSPNRPSTPVKGSALANPPQTFDEIPVVQERSPMASPDPRPGTAQGLRSSSHDRVSVHGFGSGGVNERWRNKGKARFTILMASMYLQAGRWTDSLKEAMEGATVAKSINDHIWHGKALEIITVSLLLLSWAGIEFTIPTVCMPQDKNAANHVQEDGVDTSQPECLRRFQAILPELLDRILALYSRISAEHLPMLPMYETIIRFARILAAMYVADGKLGGQSLDMMIIGTAPDKTLSTCPRPMVTPPRMFIVALLMRVFPGPGADILTTPDRVTILSGIATVLGLLGYQRKKALVIRELVSVVIGGLVEARTRGAAEVGIHPAAGLVALNNINGHSNGAVLQLAESDVEHGIEAFLDLIMKTYGVVAFDMPSDSQDDKSDEPIDPDSDAACLKRIQKHAAARVFGVTQLKVNILRASINFSEALPDFAGVLKYSSDLMRTAGSGIAPGPRQEDAAPRISMEEQVRLVTNISKTHSLTERIGLGDMEAEYWDEFLLRGMKLEPQAITRTPIEHAKSELPGFSSTRTSQDVNPFIHNPFQKKPDKVAMVSNIVAGEPVTFKLTLQNPYDVEVDIVSAKIATEGAEFESVAEQALIGAYRTQSMRITGIPKVSGSLRITGALIRVRGCRERRFPIFSDPWSLGTEPKIKATGLAALDHTLSLPAPSYPLPNPHSINVNVVAQQPVLIVKSTTLPQSSVMILEGERQTFSVTLQNLSTTPADFLLFSFQDSTQEHLQSALNDRNATPVELYEYELILAKKQALRLSKPVSRRYIAPGDTTTIEFEILGKAGLTNAGILIDYAYFGVSPEEIDPRFFTRQVSLQLNVTVNASVDVARLDVLPLHGSIPQPLWARTGKTGEQSHLLTSDEYCLLLLDLRNAWPSSMIAQLEIEDGAVIEEHLLPGNTNRVIVPIRRIYLEDPHASIPALNPSRHRQFVVSTSQISPDVERSNREAFWYREKILAYLKGTWKTGNRPMREGAIELRNMRLTTRMIEAIKVDEVGIEISVEKPAASTNSSDMTTTAVAKQVKREANKNVVHVDEFVQIRLHITNRTEQPIYPTLRLMPALCHRPLNVALDYTRKFAWNGTLQQFLPLLPGKGSTDVLVGVTALCRGEFEITASVEETKVYRATGAEDDKRRGSLRDSSARLRVTAGTPAGPEGRPRSSTQELLDLALGARERRIWHSRQPCRLVVREQEEE